MQTFSEKTFMFRLYTLCICWFRAYLCRTNLILFIHINEKHENIDCKDDLSASYLIY